MAAKMDLHHQGFDSNIGVGTFANDTKPGMPCQRVICESETLSIRAEPFK